MREFDRPPRESHPPPRASGPSNDLWVRSAADLSSSPDRVRAQVAARRWRRDGRAVVLHNGPLSTADKEGVALANCGPRAVLTAFTAATAMGLRGWDRPAIHILVPSGTRIRSIPGIETRIHYVGDWASVDRVTGRPIQRLAPALLRGAASLPSERSACGLLAAAVQQRLVTADRLLTELERSGRVRHRRILRLALHDIGQGAQALSEIDFANLCRRHGLPTPMRQGVRLEPNGRRRYVDALWELADGRTVGAEVDGALHMAAASWTADQLRQNEIVLGGTLLLRYPSVVFRTDEDLVARQLARALGIA